MAKINVYDMQGKVKGQMDLPGVFSREVRTDLIQRAFLSLMSNSRRKHSKDPMSGKRTSAHYHGRRNVFQSMANREMARGPRITGQGYLNLRLRFAPHAVKGRLAHPPTEDKIFAEKINDKERRIAILSAIAATADKGLVSGRGHRTPKIDLPIVIDDSLQKAGRTNEVEKLLLALGLSEELERAAEKTIRAGRGKSRGRKYKGKTGPLIIVSRNEGVAGAARNIEGVDVIELSNINAKLLAPGGKPGRLAVWTESAVKKLSEYD
ncbi:MAG: 50S ribosomal protein L4 [Candidatus Aenigmarchaeota archaeon]|nr:50S ribosomal protein L4 [Candidatus Aenigmarchaeota archaeon]